MTESRRSSLWLRMALRAYPQQWRSTRETELLDVLHDSVPDRPHWPGVRALIDLMVGGWRTRWRMHPPIWRWLGYRLFDVRLPARWREWARNDINGRWWFARRVATVLIPLAFVVTESMILFHGVARYIAGPVYLTVFIAVLPLSARRMRPKSMRRHAPYTPPAMWVWTNVWVAAPLRSRATPFLVPMGLLLTIGGPAAVWSLLYPNSGSISRTLSIGSDEENLGHIFGLTWGVVGLGAALLVLLLVWSRHRVPDRLASRQPGSQISWRDATGTMVAVLVLQLVLETGICVGQLGGDIPGIFCLVLAGAGIGVGPALVALAIVARRSERLLGIDVTWRDCERAIVGTSKVIAPEIGQWVGMPRLLPIEGPQLP